MGIIKDNTEYLWSDSIQWDLYLFKAKKNRRHRNDSGQSRRPQTQSLLPLPREWSSISGL